MIIMNSKTAILFFLSFLFLIFFCSDLCWSAENTRDPLREGINEYNNGNFEEALSEFEKAVESRPADANGHYYLGLCLSRLGKNDEAALALEKAAELDSKIPGLHLNLGIVYYKLKVFEPALMEFGRALKEDPEDASSNFFKGLTYQGMGEYDKSISYLDKARKLDPEYTQLYWYYLGLAHYKKGREEEAKDAFNKAIDARPQSDTAEDAKSFLKTMETKIEEEKRWSIRPSAGAEYNDNLSVEESDEASGIEDWALVFEFDGKYKFLDKKPFEAEIKYNFYQSLYELFRSPEEDASEFDTHSHTAGISVGLDFDKWDIGLDYDYNYTLLGGDSFLQTHNISPSFGFFPFPVSYVNIGYFFAVKDFLEKENNPRDAISHSGGIDIFIFFMKFKGYIQAGYRLEDQDADGSEFDYLGHIANGAIQIPLPYRSKVRLTYQYKFKDFKNITPSISDEREDRRHTFGAALAKKIFKHLEFEFDYKHINNNSNLPSVDYHENVIYMGVAYIL